MGDDYDFNDVKITLTSEESRIASPQYEYTFDPLHDTTSGITVTMPDFDAEENWPSEYKVNEMILRYPALKIQYEKFLEVYNLVKDDYKNDIELLE
jgi:hypothetical protein